MKFITLNIPISQDDKKVKIGLLFICIVVSCVIALQQFYLGSYNNFEIFSSSFNHLTSGLNLYTPYPTEYDDLFLYNPTFTILFRPFALLPTWLGMLLWTVGGMVVFLFAVYKLPISNTGKLLILALTLPDSINSLQHMQVNHINLALLLFTFIHLRNNRPFLAALFTVIIFYIKVYPAAVGLCFLFFPNKGKYLAGCMFWSIALFALPLLFIPFSGLIQQYQNWFTSLGNDKTIEECATALSLISINYQWLDKPINPTFIQLVGLTVMMLPLLLKRTFYKNDTWQLLYLSAILLFIIVFNHAAESATYLLAVTGVAIWYNTSQKSMRNNLLLGFVLILTILTITDLFPPILKKEFVQPYSLRAVPCLFVWIKIMFDLLQFKLKK